VGTGYVAKIAKQTSEGKDLPLPDIDFEEDLKSGLEYFFALVFYFLIFLSITLLLISPWLIPLLSNNGTDNGQLVAVPINIVVLLLEIVFAIYYCSSLSIAMVEENPWAIFHFRRTIPMIFKNKWKCLGASFMIFLFNFIGQIGVWMCFIGLIITVPLSGLWRGHLYGQMGLIMKETNK